MGWYDVIKIGCNIGSQCIHIPRGRGGAERDAQLKGIRNIMIILAKCEDKDMLMI